MITVIMPLYNAEKYLDEALQSVLNQTYKEIELICINDASTDKTLQILQHFQSGDQRIKIITNEKQLGAAESRNKGIIQAQGEYITFLDGDDIFEEEMLQLAQQVMEKHNTDIVLYELMHVPSEKIYQKRSIMRGEQFIEKYCKVPFTIKSCEPIAFMNWTSSPCNKLYRKSFIIKNQLEFQTLSSANDVYFVDMALLLAEKIIMLEDRRVMVYARDHQNPTRISFERDPMCAYRAMEKIGKELVKRGVFAELFQHYYVRFFFSLKYILLKTKKRENAEKFYAFLQDEGIENIVSLGAELSLNMDSYVKRLCSQYQELDFESNWFCDETVLNYYLQKEEDKVISLFKSYIKKNAKVAVWGVGENGKGLLKFLTQHNLKIAEVVDRDESKQGRIIGGYVINKPENILNRIQIIMVTTYLAYQDVIKAVQGRDIEVIDIGKMVGKD